jgi:hypothetical protein
MSGFERLRRAYTGVAIFWLNATLVFLVANAGVAVIHSFTDEPDVEESATRLFFTREMATMFRDLGPAELEQLQRESVGRLVYEPYTEFAEQPFRGRFVNVVEHGFRQSRDQGPWPPDPAYYNVFLFGGSTSFGVGVPDDHTIASVLQPILGRVEGREARVYNFGRSGYYSTQERILFEQLLTRGFVPDAAVFIDGLNDFAHPDDRPLNGDWLEYCMKRFRTSGQTDYTPCLDLVPLTRTVRHALRILGRHVPGVAEAAPPYDDPVAADRVIQRYARNKRHIEAVAATWGIRPVFVWQPVPGYNFPPGVPGRWLLASLNGYARFGYPRMVDYAARTPLGDRFVWCADVGADGTERLYVDPVHYSPEMSERVARCIAEGVRTRRLLN